MVGFPLHRLTYGPPIHSYGAFNTWVEWRHSLGVRKQVVDGEPGLHFDMLWSLGMLDTVQIMFWHSWVCIEKLVRRKVYGKHFGAQPFYRLVGENTATHPLLYEPEKVSTLSRYSLKQHRKVCSGVLGLKSTVRNPNGLEVA